MKTGKKTTANVAKFKNQLGEFLRLVKKGEEVIVLDRLTPVAKLIPYKEEEPFKLETSKPKRVFGGFEKFHCPPLSPSKTDSLALLLEDRAKR